MGKLYRRVMLNSSVVNTATGGYDVTNTSLPLLTTEAAATPKPRYTVNGLTGGCDNIAMLNFMLF
jgi:hypothetical protein